MDVPLFPTGQGKAVLKGPMVETMRFAARALDIPDAADGSERVSGHSLRATGAEGLVRLGWRPDAVRLMGRWDSEIVCQYTRLAALESPTGLELDMARLCGVTPSEVPAPAEEESAPAREEGARWILNPASQIFHTASATDGRARCGWLFGRAPHTFSDTPPPFFWEACPGCAPKLRARLKAEANAAASEVRRSNPEP